MDDDDRSASIRNLVRAMTDEKLRATLRSRYVNWANTPISEVDPEILAALAKMQVKDRRERGEHFDELYCEMRTLWEKLSTCSEMQAFQRIRDKVSAHTEIQFQADKYQFVDMSKLGLKWGDMKNMVEAMQRVVELLGLLIRSAGFAWEMLDEQLDTASKKFWAHH